MQSDRDGDRTSGKLVSARFICGYDEGFSEVLPAEGKVILSYWTELLTERQDMMARE